MVDDFWEEKTPTRDIIGSILISIKWAYQSWTSIMSNNYEALFLFLNEFK